MDQREQDTTTTSLRSKLQLYVLNSLKSLQNTVNDSNSSSIRNIYRLLTIVDFIVCSRSPSSQQGLGLDEKRNKKEEILNEFQLDFKEYSKASLRSEFMRSFYSTCLSQLLSNFNPNLYTNDNNNNKNEDNYKSSKDLFLNIMSNACFTDTFNVIYDMSLSLSPSRQRDFCIFLMNQFVRRHLIRDMLAENIDLSVPGSNHLIENELVRRLINLPDKFSVFLTNTDRKNEIFLPRNYFKIVSADLWNCLSSKIASKLDNKESIGFLSNVFAKICFLGYCDMINASFLANLIKSCYDSGAVDKWRATAKSLIESTSMNYLETVLLNLVNFSSSHEDLDILLDDLVLTNSNVRYFLLDKFVFLKVFKKDKPIQNLIGYLHESPTRRVLYYELFKKLLNSWSTKASIVNTSHEQHVYLTKCILICVSFMDSSDKSVLVNDLLSPILNGVQKHLCSPIERVRTLGMIVGENMMNDLAWAGRSCDELKQLKFEYEQTDEVKWLISLRTKPDWKSVFRSNKRNCDNDEIGNNDLLEAFESSSSSKLDVDDADKNQTASSTLFENRQLNIKISQMDLDSDDDDDDDLVPYDLSNDVPLVKTNQPAYLRDCLDSLIYADDPEKIEVTLRSVEKLCETYHFELQEICVELLKVLLHKSNSHSIENFDQLKANAMISVTVHYPIECAQYLTSQFYEQNYSFSQRTDILHVLAMSAQKLSSPNEEPIFDKRIMQSDEQKMKYLLPNLIAFNQRPAGEGSEWREAVQKRIEAKTRVKKSAASNSHKSQLKAKENKYSDVYGHFFFPLMSPYDKKRVHTNLMEQDFELLGKLIYSLAIILYSAVNTTVIENMISAFTEFLWSIRNHIEPFVRKSIIFGFTIIVMVVSDNQLFVALTSYFLELKFWLQNIVMNDTDSDCQKRALDCLNLLAQRVKGKLIGADNNDF